MKKLAWLIALFAACAYAQSAPIVEPHTITFDAVPGSTGYRFYCADTSAGYAAKTAAFLKLDFPAVTPATKTFSMTVGQFCALTSYGTNASGSSESGFSNEVKIPLALPTAPGIPQNLKVTYFFIYDPVAMKYELQTAEAELAQ